MITTLFKSSRPRPSSRALNALLYAGLISPAIFLAVLGGASRAGQLPVSAFQAYNSANAASIVPGTFALYSVSVDSISPTQLNEGYSEVGKKTAGFDLLAPSQLQANLLTDIEPVIIGPGGQLYLTDGHHTFTALEKSIYGASNPTVFVNVIANYSNLTTAQFFAMLEANNDLLPLDKGAPQTVNLGTGAPIPTMLTALTNDPYRGLEYAILKNKSSALFPTAANETGAIGASTPGLDKMTGFYLDFLEAAAYRDANGGLGLPYLSPGDIALATAWNLKAASSTTIPNVTGTVTAAQLPGFILSSSIVNAGGISNATLANGALDGNGTFTGITTINAGTSSAPITIGTPNTGFILQLGADKGNTVTLNGVNTYTGGTSLLAGTLIAQSDASLGAAATGAAIDPNNVKTSVQAANGIVFNSLTEGNAILQIGTASGAGAATFSTSRAIGVSGETATINVNGYLVSLSGSLYSFGSGGNGLGNATGVSDLTIDDNASNLGKLVLSAPSPNFYGNIIIGNTNAPTVEVMNDAALGATTGPAATLGQVDLNGGTLQAGASFAAPERNIFLGGGSNFDVNGFSTTWGTLTNVQRTLDILNSNTTTAGAVTFNNLTIGAASTIQLAGGAAGETVTFNNGINRAGNDTLILQPSSSTSLGTTEKVLSGVGATSLVNTIAPAWIVTNNGASKSVGPYDFVTYGANGYVKAAYTSTAALSGATAAQVVALSGPATLAGDASVYALNTEGKTIAVGAHTLTIGDGTNAGGLILATGSQINGGTLAFGGSEGVVWLSGANSSISSQITGSNGLTFSGSGAVSIGAAANVSGPITIDSGTVTLSAANVFANNSGGILLDDAKTKPAPAGLAITANNTLAALNSVGTNSTVAISNGAALTLGDTVNNRSSTLSSTITETGAAVAGALTFNGSGLFDLSGGKITLAAGSTAVVNNSAQLRVTASEVSKSNFGITLNGTSQLQLAENGGQVLTNAISGTGALHLIGGTVQITGTSNTYSGGTFLETGSTLDITTANLPAINPNIVNAGGLVVFDQATGGTYSGVISDGAQMGVGATLSGALDKDDSSGANSGNVTLALKQSYTGATTVEAGTLTLGALDTIATSSGVDLGRVGGCVGTCGGAPAATLALAADNTIQSLSSEASNTTAVTLGANTLTINPAAGVSATFGGAIIGTGALVKTGAGTQALSGASTYSGGTTVQAGLLAFTGSLVSTGATTVNGGTLAILNGGSLMTSSTTVNGGTLAIDANGSMLTSDSVSIGAAGGLIAPAGNLAGVATLSNAGLLDIRNGAAGNVVSVGSYTGFAGSQLLVGVDFNGHTADKLSVTMATGSTQIVVTPTGANAPFAYNPNGIPIVLSANPSNPSAFTLAGGPLQRGLFQYDLAYQPDPAFVLVSVPTADVYRLATVPTVAQSIWLDTAGIWLDRQADLRDIARANGGSIGSTSASGLSVWARGVGEWTNRSQSQTYSILNKSYNFQTGYNLATGGFFAGADGAYHGLASPSDTLLFGLTGGYVNSAQSFNGTTTAATYEGGSIGVSGTYLNHGLFVDALFKADILRLGFSAASAAGFGAATNSSSATSLGGLVDAGYRFDLGGKSFIEPLGSLSWVNSRVGGLGIAGAQIGFGDHSTLRGQAGLRAGSALFDNADYRFDASATAGYWYRISGRSGATINSGPSAPLLSVSDTQVNGYGDIGLGLNLLGKTSGWSGFIKGSYQYASGFNAGTVKGGVRYSF